MRRIIKKKKSVAFIIPAHNEQTVIELTINSLLALVPPADIYVVSDGSTDQTVTVAKKLTPNVLDLNPNVGKASALNSVIQHFNLTKNYSYIMPVDADSKVDKDFLSCALQEFEQSNNSEYLCAVVGKVVGTNVNWITAYRVWEYEVAQTIHKSAQSHLNSIIVCPGPSTIYRASVFKHLKIPTGTLTEDMDLTFLIHRQKLGKIKYCSKAMVFTQDPKSLRDFLRQIDRWHTGFWQCIKRHNLPWGGQRLDTEVALLAVEGLYNGALTSAFLILLPFVLITNSKILLWPLTFDLIFFVFPTLILAAKNRNDWGLFRHIISFYAVRFLTSLVFLKSFLKVVIGFDLGMGWNKVKRYDLGLITGKEKIWATP